MQLVKQRVWFDNSHKNTDTVTFEQVDPDSWFEGKWISEHPPFLPWEITKKPQGQCIFKIDENSIFNKTRQQVWSADSTGILRNVKQNWRQTTVHRENPRAGADPLLDAEEQDLDRRPLGKVRWTPSPTPYQLFHTAEKTRVHTESRDKPHVQKAVPFCGRRKGEFLHLTNHVRDSTAPLTWQETLENTGSWNTHSFND